MDFLVSFIDDNGHWREDRWYRTIGDAREAANDIASQRRTYAHVIRIRDGHAAEFRYAIDRTRYANA